MAPIKRSIDTIPSSSFLTEVNRQPKLDSIPRPSAPISDQNQHKNLLKGKPIIFVGGGPGIIRINLMKKK